MAKKRLRQKRIGLHLTETEFEMVKEKSKACNLSMSEYLRKMCVNGVIIHRDFAAISEVNKIGININQIARKVNERDIAIAGDIADLQFQFDRLFEVIYGNIIDG